MKFIIGKKIEMTQVWQGEKMLAVTKVLAGPCPVVQLKNIDSDGYTAVQLGFGQRKEKNISKPQIGRLKKAGLASKDGKINLRYYREFRDEVKDLKVGDVVLADTFTIGDVVKITGASKGKGFQGGVKRHGWHGHNTTHGTKDQVRTSGSIGAGGPQHVFKNKKMPGRMGNDRVTTSNLRIVQVDQPNNILYISGAVPGARGSVVLVYGDGELKVAQPKAAVTETVTEKKVETGVKVEDSVKSDVRTETVKTEIAVEKKEPLEIKKAEIKK
ncbi:MAG: 50S ribosomal protein L3 [Parcubacteria group bacterium GW2011_GWC2_42_12]|uniref:Large ribosomal subunit protein uL3 n=1 Tax=Candidatus Falkowbacteria bacterium GW2011_GWA2_41_14 TaxID=1618635 RepID=A0A0G0USC8_9BACT|nr:MAG: 50S ribosomal protein L3 [Candidatus Falkowbacteria bacterium GW2011_GWA2_41_14]KKS35139.1 MAG: 50S ribosomal protein L3 [Parcubacteria group bacterium GW2011_GWC2_42_12]